MGDRLDVLRRLKQDLIGPLSEDELLESRPSDVYLTGVLWPRETAREPDPEADDNLGAETGADDDAGESEAVRASAITRPSTAGVSFSVRSASGAPSVEVEVLYGAYEPEESEREGGGRAHVRWRRRARRLFVRPVVCAPGVHTIALAAPPAGVNVEAADRSAPPQQGVELYLRAVAHGDQALVTLTLINSIVPAGSSRLHSEQATLFQTELRVRPHKETMLCARPSRRAAVDADDMAAALLYRHAHEYAAGHTCGADWTAPGGDGLGGEVRATWMPQAMLPAVSGDGHDVFRELGAGGDDPRDAVWLAGTSRARMCSALRRVPQAYRTWIVLKGAEADALAPEFAGQARAHLAAAETVAAAMEDCVARLEANATAAEAFQLANRAMAQQFAWSGKAPGQSLHWRPFQLGFMLLSLPSLIDRGHPDRGVMDLLWFPTGGGKTEAYLGLIAFLAFWRRLSSPVAPDGGGGVAAIMRYTLRLLTTQQFERAAAMILACDLARRQDAARLGDTPFSIGLWVGGDATPNSYEKASESLSSGDPDLSSPRQLMRCPACGGMLGWRAIASERRIEVRCDDTECVLEGPLPVFTVDEDVYRECPTLLIGTIDKFAQIVRSEDWRALFGFPGAVRPDLIIQDELHLISGPLGTIAGLYEAAIDRLLEVDGARAKVIGSTATIRRADDQIRAVFDRRARLFPPSGLDAADSGFAVRDSVRAGRLYAGVTTAGRSAKFTLQAVAASLLQSGAAAFADDAEADPYRTLVSYFNSLRELGGALVLMQDDVADSIALYAARRGETARAVESVEELTSRRSQAEVRDMLEALARRAGDPGMLDVVLASNMLSVGVDVPRLALMLVNGQPKGIAEYIQATSRIGRGAGPGLVITVLNNAKARDRSHFETFRTWHETLYRDVEATSVTPFAARARDRALHAVLVALVRTLVPQMSSQPDLTLASDAAIAEIRSWIIGRAQSVDAGERDVAVELDDLIDEWRRRAPAFYWNDWRVNRSLVQSAERAAMRRANGRAPGAAWPTMNNMRSVEASSHFRLAEGLRPPREDNSDGGQ